MMEAEAFETLKAIRAMQPLVGYDDVEGEDRTLMLGYLLDRDSVHVYLRGASIHRVVSGWRGNVKSHRAKQWWAAEELLRDQKRWYPEHCDQEFCVKVGRAKGWIEFTTFDESRRAVTDGLAFFGEMCGCQMWQGRH